jgi:peptidyl-prolyl cis-trans isomerase D
MLKKMRNDFKKYSWTLWLVMLAFVLGFIAIDAFRPGGGPDAKDELIYIGDTTIKAGDFQDQLHKTLLNYKERFKENFDKRLITQMGLPEQVLQNQINTTILRNEAEKLNITASDEEVREKIITNPSFQVNGKFIGLAEYKLRLSYAHLRPTEFENELKEEIVLQKFQDLVTTGIVIDGDTLREKYSKEKDEAKLDFILLKSNTIKETPEVSDSEITEFYEKNKEDFKSQERRAGNIIALKFDDYKSELKITAKDMLDYYKQNQANYVDPEKIKVSRILLKYNKENEAEIEKKAIALQAELNKDNFAQKARELSEDDKAQNGGDYGYFEWQNFTAQEKTIIDSLKEFEVSSPVNTQSGYSLLFISEKVDKKQKEFDKVRDIIRDTMEKQKLDELVTDKITAIYKKVKDAENIKEPAEKMSVKVIDSGLVVNGAEIKDVDPNGYLSRQLFQLKQNQISTPVTYANGMAIVQLLQIEGPKVESLENVKDRVKERAIEVKKLAVLMERGKAITAELNVMTDEKAIEKYLKDKDLNATEITYKRGNRLSSLPEKEGLDDLIFSLTENRYSDPIEFKMQAAIVKVKSKTIKTQADYEKDKIEFYTQKLREAKNSYFASYMIKKREEYNVRINQELYQKIKDYVLGRL